MMRRNPERLAWTILLFSLFFCLVLATSIPLAVRSLVNDSALPLNMTLEVQQGTALVRLPGSDVPIGVTTAYPNLPEGAAITTADANTQALLTLRLPHSDTILQTVQIYGNTDAVVSQAQLPRFDMSIQPHRIRLRQNLGRLRLSVAGSARPLETIVSTPHADAALHEGSYAVEVTADETQVTVRDGLAQVSAQGVTREVNPQLRTVIRLNAPPSEVLSPERNLVTNGNFRLPLEGTWEVYNDLQNPDEQPGTVKIQTIGGQRSAVVDRAGFYHAETGLRQMIGKNVSGFASLRLHFVVRVFRQDVPVCGQAGSECPMMMRLDYKDQNGTALTFLQGFYAIPDPANPTYNTSSGDRKEHIRVPLNFPYTFDSGNLMETLQPSQITGITFYASGHTYRSSVAEIELLGEQ
jgi:hypothetical protein